MGNCVNCFYQGDSTTDENGNCRIFCLVSGKWFQETGTCDHFTMHADLSKEIRSQFAAELRRDNAEDRRMSRVYRAGWKLVLITLVTSVILFMIVVKFFDKFIF